MFKMGTTYGNPRFFQKMDIKFLKYECDRISKKYEDHDKFINNDLKNKIIILGWL